MKVERLERISNAKITLVTDSYVNFVEASGKVRFAYYSSCDENSPVDIFEEAIRKDKPVDMLLERVQKGKLYDYIIEVQLVE